MAYRLVIHDDAKHTFEYVVRLFVRVLGVSAEEAFALASQIHEEGSASVNFFELATARETEEHLLSAGRDTRLPDSLSSLAVAIEETTGATTHLVSRGRLGPRGYERLDEKQLALLHAQSVARHGSAPPRVAALSRREHAHELVSETRRLLTVMVVLGLLALLLRMFA
jgi:ATP-dependent Clp protease adapter protein ClpS